jgi:hypothetical protein
MYRYLIGVAALVCALAFSSTAGAARAQHNGHVLTTGKDPIVTTDSFTDPGGGGGAPFACNASRAWAIMMWAGYFWQCRPTATGWQWVIYGEAPGCSIVTVAPAQSRQAVVGG